jgi:hypothetical protein
VICVQYRPSSSASWAIISSINIALPNNDAQTVRQGADDGRFPSWRASRGQVGFFVGRCDEFFETFQHERIAQVRKPGGLLCLGNDVVD